MDTITAWVQMLRPGIHTKAHRQVNSSVYYVFEGRGATVIGGVRFDWEQGDMFVIPTWAYHEHINESPSDRAILFSIHDTPVLVALGKYREEALTANGGISKSKGIVRRTEDSWQTREASAFCKCPEINIDRRLSTPFHATRTLQGRPGRPPHSYL